MNRRENMLLILMSLTVLVALMASVASLGTFDRFTDDESESSKVNSGNLKIGITGEGSFAFDKIECQELTPNDICTATAIEENEGDLQLAYTGSTSSDNTCFDPSIASVSTTSGESTLSAVGITMAHIEVTAGAWGNGDALDPKEMDTYTLSVEELYTDELTVPLAQPGCLYHCSSPDDMLEHFPASVQVFGEIKDEYGRLEQLLNGVRE